LSHNNTNIFLSLAADCKKINKRRAMSES